MKLFGIFKGFSKKTADSGRDASSVLSREMLEKKVDQGVSRAVKEYGEVFRRLAEYDKKA